MRGARSLLCGSWIRRCSAAAAPKRRRQRRWPSGAWLWWVLCVCVWMPMRPQTTRERTRERARESARGFLAWALSQCRRSPTCFLHWHLLRRIPADTHTEAGLCWILFVDASADGQQPLLSLSLPLPVHAAHVALDCDDSCFLIALLLLPLFLLLLPLLFAACGCCCCCSA